MKGCWSALLFLQLLSGGAVTSADATKNRRRRHLQEVNNSKNNSKNWWELGMGDEILDEVALYYLGQAWYQGADVADVLDTIYRVNVSDPWSWTMEWRKTANRMERLAQESEVGGKLLK